MKKINESTRETGENSIEIVRQSNNVFLVGDKLDHLVMMKDLLDTNIHMHKIPDSKVTIVNPIQFHSEYKQSLEDNNPPDYIIWKGLSNSACENLSEDEAKIIFDSTMDNIIDHDKTKIIPIVTSSSDRNYMIKKGALSGVPDSYFGLFNYIWSLKEQSEEMKQENILYLGHENDDSVDFFRTHVAVKKITNVQYDCCSDLHLANDKIKQSEKSITQIMLGRDMIDNYESEEIVTALKEPLANGIKGVILFYRGGVQNSSQYNRVNKLMTDLGNIKPTTLYKYEMDWCSAVERDYKD